MLPRTAHRAVSLGKSLSLSGREIPPMAARSGTPSWLLVPPLAELRRVLAPGGRLIVVVNHPFHYKLQYRDADYFAPREYSEEYTLSGQSVTLTYWHRPLHAMTDAFTEAGFRIAVVSEPPPAPGTRERFPWVFKDLPSATAFLCFLFFVLEAA